MAYTKTYYTYILTNYENTVLYIGITNNLERRLSEHKQGLIDGFTKKYQCKYLVYYEDYSDVNNAIAREKQLKRWVRLKKDNLISKINPGWKDLSAEWR